MITERNAQPRVCFAQKDSRGLVTPARVIAAAAPVHRQHDTIGVERSEHAMGRAS